MHFPENVDNRRRAPPGQVRREEVLSYKLGVQWLPNVLAAVSQWIHLAASVTLQLTARSSPCPVKTLKNGTIISFSDIWPGKFEPKLTSCLDRNCWMLSFYYPSEIELTNWPGNWDGRVWVAALALVCTRGLHIGRILWLNLDRAQRTVFWPVSSVSCRLIVCFFLKFRSVTHSVSSFQ